MLNYTIQSITLQLFHRCIMRKVRKHTESEEGEIGSAEEFHLQSNQLSLNATEDVTTFINAVRSRNMLREEQEQNAKQT